MSLEKIENSLKKCPDLPEIKMLGWQLCNITDFMFWLTLGAVVLFNISFMHMLSFGCNFYSDYIKKTVPPANIQL
jgi:hypothetical protein